MPLTLPLRKNGCCLMTAINITPISLSLDGLFTKTPEEICEKVQKDVDHGAHIIDIGAESTRPGSTPISATTEIERLSTILPILRNRFPKTFMSLDTYHPETMEYAINQGVDCINDISGGSPEIFELVGSHPDIYYIWTHNKALDREVETQRGQALAYKATDQENFLETFSQDIEKGLEKALKTIHQDKIILDMGLCFGKKPLDNLSIIKRIPEYREKFPFPILLGYSNKSFIGDILDKVVTERLYGTLAITAMACFYGADIIRVHNIDANKQVMCIIETFNEAT